MDILISGATGYLGSRLVHDLIAKGFQVVALVRSRPVNGSLLSLISDSKALKLLELDPSKRADVWSQFPDIPIFVNAATNYGRSGTLLPVVRDANLIFPTELIKGGIAKGLRAFINLDTFFSKQNPYLDVAGHKDYADTKRAFASSLVEFQSKIHLYNLRIEHMYGPNDNLSKFIPWVIQNLSRDDVQSLPLTEGRSIRDFIFVDDVVDAISAQVSRTHNQLSAHPPQNYGGEMTTFDIGTGIGTEVRSIPIMVKQLTGSRANLDFGAVKGRDGEIHESISDRMFQKFHSWNPQVPLEEGLRRILETS